MTATRAAMSFAGAVGFGKETTFGVAVSRTDWIVAKQAQPTIKRGRETSAAIAYDWETLLSTPGLWEVGVNIGYQLYASSAIQNLINAFATRAPFNDATYDKGQPYSYTVELVMDNGSSVLITGCRANQGQISVKTTEVVSGSVDFMGKAASVISSTSPSPATGALYHGGYTTMTIDATPVTLPNSFELTVNNNAQRRYSFTGDGTARNVRGSNQVVRGNMQADCETTDLLDAFLAGSDAALNVTVTGADGSTLVIDVPLAHYEGDDPGLNDGNPIEDKLPFLADKDSGAGYAFTATVNADTTAPTCTSVPADAATGVAIDANVVFTFSEELRTSSVGTHSVVLLKDGVQEIAGAVALVNNGASTTVTFNPTASLENSTNYTCVLTTEVKDLAGNRIAATKVVNFTTVAP